MIQKLTRQQFWQQRYRARPYLQHSSEQDIADRLRYIIENMTVLLPDGRIGVLPPEPNGKLWYELFQNARDEHHRRGIQPPMDFLKDALVPKPSFPIPPAAVLAMRGISLPEEGTYLVKLGMREHMQDLYGSGRIRIAPAGKYDDPSLNAAIRDDELSLSTFGLQSEVLIEFTDKAGNRHSTHPIGNLRRTMRSATDYYVYCMTTKLDPRLFGDFGYDACVIIHDHMTFEARLSAAVAAHLPEWIGSGGPVDYVDPFQPTGKDFSLFHGKHHRYWYQREYRCVWTPPTDAQVSLLPFFVELGSLKDIGELVVLNAD